MLTYTRLLDFENFHFLVSSRPLFDIWSCADHAFVIESLEGYKHRIEVVMKKLTINAEKVTEWGGPSDGTGKTKTPCHSRCGTIKIPSCSKSLSAEHRPKFCSPSPAMVTSPHMWKNFARDVKQLVYRRNDIFHSYHRIILTFSRTLRPSGMGITVLFGEIIKLYQVDKPIGARGNWHMRTITARSNGFIKLVTSPDSYCLYLHYSLFAWYLLDFPLQAWEPPTLKNPKLWLKFVFFISAKILLNHRDIVEFEKIYTGRWVRILWDISDLR
jgi:hypothetical protein